MLPVLFEASTSARGSNPFQVATLTQKFNLNPGASATLHFSIPVASGSPTGHQYVVAVVDPMNSFKESNLSDKVSVSRNPVDFT